MHASHITHVYVRVWGTLEGRETVQKERARKKGTRRKKKGNFVNPGRNIERNTWRHTGIL
jgi:hypothetical protein